MSFKDVFDALKNLLPSVIKELDDIRLNRSEWPARLLWLNSIFTKIYDGFRKKPSLDKAPVATIYSQALLCIILALGLIIIIIDIITAFIKFSGNLSGPSFLPIFGFLILGMSFSFLANLTYSNLRHSGALWYQASRAIRMKVMLMFIPTIVFLTLLP